MAKTYLGTSILSSLSRFEARSKRLYGGGSGGKQWKNWVQSIMLGGDMAPEEVDMAMMTAQQRREFNSRGGRSRSTFLESIDRRDKQTFLDVRKRGAEARRIIEMSIKGKTQLSPGQIKDIFGEASRTDKRGFPIFDNPLHLPVPKGFYGDTRGTYSKEGPWSGSLSPPQVRGQMGAPYGAVVAGTKYHDVGSLVPTSTSTQLGAGPGNQRTQLGIARIRGAKERGRSGSGTILSKRGAT